MVVRSIKAAMVVFIVLLAVSGMAVGADKVSEKLDRDKDGRLDIKELDEAAQALFKKYDKNRDGSLDRAEFEAIRGAQSPFASLDASQDGKIDAAELKKAAEKRFNQCDRNNDGYLDPGELEACVVKSVQDGGKAVSLDKSNRVRLFDRSQDQSIVDQDLKGTSDQDLETSSRHKTDMAPLFSVYF